MVQTNNNQNHMQTIKLITLLSIIHLCSCAIHISDYTNVTCCKDNQYVFRNKWFDYYHCALTCMEQSSYSESVILFDVSIKRRPKDQYMARTFGMNFVDYFPHREKGIALYHLSLYPQAQQELIRSTTYKSTDKAKFFLDKIRLKILEKQKSISKPKIYLNQFKYKKEIWSNDDPIKLSGAITDENFVSEVCISNRQLKIDASEKKISFHEFFDWPQGQHDIIITAKNLSGYTSTKKYTIHIDRCGPLIILKSITDAQIKGTLIDAAGGMALFVVSKKIIFQDKTKVDFVSSFPPGESRLTLIAVDKLGNKTKAIVNKQLRSNGAPIDKSIKLASVDDTLVTSDENKRYINANNPIIQINSWENNQIVYAEKILLKGHIQSNGGIKYLKINNDDIAICPGILYYFTHEVQLQNGFNTINIQASSNSNQTVVKSVRLIKHIKEVEKQKYRYQFAMHAFDHSDGFNDTDMFQYHLIDGLLAKKRFQIVLRNDLQKLFLKQEIDLNKLSLQSLENKTQSIIEGMIYVTKEGIETITRIFDQSSKIINVIDAFHPLNSSVDILERLVKQTSHKFHQSFPMIEGTITGQKNHYLILYPEKYTPCKSVIEPGWPVILYRQDHPGQNSVIIDTVDIIQVTKNSFKISLPKRNTIKIGDKFITQ